MAALNRFALRLAPFLLLAGCAATPSAPVATAPAPFVGNSGLVIGTMSYQYVEAGQRAADQGWVMHFERLDMPAQDYAMPVDYDPQRRSGIFTGALPAGVYTFRGAQSAQRRFAAGGLRMPFEVQPGSVQDAGHYPLNPVLSAR